MPQGRRREDPPRATLDDPLRERLTVEIEDEAERRDLPWNAVAVELDMSTQNLLRIREGSVSVSPKAARALDEFLSFEPGGVRALLAGEEPVRQPRKPRREVSPDQRRKMQAMDFDRVVAFTREIMAGSELAGWVWLQEAARTKVEMLQNAQPQTAG